MISTDSAAPTPLVSVVMITHNGARFLREALDSVLAQSFTAFELVVVNDGSTDETREILKAYRDPRLRLFDCAHDFVASLNYGLDMAQGKYVARQDDDDVSLPGRLAAEVEYMESHDEVGLVGSSYIRITEDGSHQQTKELESEDAKIRWLQLFANQFRATSVMFRRSLAREVGGYRERYGDDYDMWSRMAQKTKVANLKQPLVKFRTRLDSFSSIHGTAFERASLRISLASISHVIGYPFEPELVRRLRMTQASDGSLIVHDLLDPRKLAVSVLRKTILRMIERFSAASGFDPLDQEAFTRWVMRRFSQRLLVLAHALVEHSRGTSLSERQNSMRAASRLIMEAVRSEPRLLVADSTWRLAAKALVGPDTGRGFLRNRVRH